MNESAKFEVYKKKLQGICDEHNLVYSFKKDRYPITLTVRTTGSITGQMSMLEDAEDDGYRNPDARLVFVFKDGELSFKISKSFTISDALFNKLKNLFKNMHFLWLQFFFRELMKNDILSEEQMPVIGDGEDEDDADTEDYDEMADELQPLESFEDDEDEENDGDGVGDVGADGDADDGDEDTEYEYDEPDDESVE